MSEVKTAAAWGQVWNDDAEQHAGVLIPRSRGLKHHAVLRNDPSLTRLVEVALVHIPGLTHDQMEQDILAGLSLLAKSREVCEWTADDIWWYKTGCGRTEKPSTDIDRPCWCGRRVEVKE